MTNNQPFYLDLNQMNIILIQIERNMIQFWLN